MSKSQSLVNLLAASSMAEGERCWGEKEGNKLSSQSRGLYNQLSPFIRTALHGSNAHHEIISPKYGESETKLPTQELGGHTQTIHSRAFFFFVISGCSFITIRNPFKKLIYRVVLCLCSFFFLHVHIQKLPSTEMNLLPCTHASLSRRISVHFIVCVYLPQSSWHYPQAPLDKRAGTSPTFPSSPATSNSVNDHILDTPPLKEDQSCLLLLNPTHGLLEFCLFVETRPCYVVQTGLKVKLFCLCTLSNGIHRHATTRIKSPQPPSYSHC